MTKINWARVFLCGILAGAVLYLLQLLLFVFVLRGTDFAAAVEAARASARFASPVLPFLLYLLSGIWIMWIYAAIRPRFGPGPRTAALAGLALWLLGALVDANWVLHGLVSFPPRAVVAPIAAALPAVIVAAVIGAWPYKESPKST